eukprot:SAG11_NODE_750_length_7360_cov_7.329522_2_plen_101_part_00
MIVFEYEGWRLYVSKYAGCEAVKYCTKPQCSQCPQSGCWTTLWPSLESNLSPGRSHGEQQQREHEQCHEQSLYTFLILHFPLFNLLYLFSRVLCKDPTCL